MSDSLIPVFNLEAARQQTEAAAQVNFNSIIRRNDWLEDAPAVVASIARDSISHKAKLHRFRKLADRIQQSVLPHSVCKSGCSHCCNIAAEVSGIEAELIGAEIGVTPATVRTIELGNQSRYFGTPCPFLAEGKCSIYESRPMSCRLHFSIGYSADLCSTSVAPEESSIPNVNFQYFHRALAQTFLAKGYGDIRQYFGTAPVSLPRKKS